MMLFVKDDQWVYGRRDNSFFVILEVYSYLCGIIEIKGDRIYYIFFYFKRF